MKWWYLHLLFVIAAGPALADEVEFPEEELARESVLPVFENPRDVLQRRVLTSKRFEVGAGGGMDIDEPFYNPIIFSGHLGYHASEQHGFSADALFWLPGLSSYGNQIKSDQRFQGWDASKAPHPVWGALGNYEFTAYYGKISITKHFVMNLNLFGYGGGMYINMQGYNAFGGDVGFGQNFFITTNVALRFDLRMLIFQGPNAAAANLRSGVNPSSFPNRVFYYNQSELALVVLL